MLGDHAHPIPSETSELIALVRSLIERVGSLEAEVTGLKQDNARLVEENAKLRRENMWLRKQLFGPSRERVPAAKLEDAWQQFLSSPALSPAAEPLPSMQLMLGLQENVLLPPTAPVNELPSTTPPPPPARDKSNGRDAHGRSKVPLHLPVETIVFEPDVVPEGAVRMGEDISNRLGYRPACYVRLVIVRPKYVTQDAHGVSKVTIAEPPFEMIPKGLCDPAMLARLITAKWADHQPWHRLAGIVARSGVHLAPSTMAGAATRAEPLARRLVECMWTDARAHAKVLAIDATNVKVQAKGKCLRGYPWIVVADRDHVLFDFSLTHTKDVPARLLAGFRGHVLADASSVYDAFFDREDAPLEAGCWAHARRKFVYAGLCDERALVGVRFADQLFAIERDLAEVSADERVQLRRMRSATVLGAFEGWRDGLRLRGGLDPKGPLLKAILYTVRHWEPLRRFLGSGDVPIHNNFTELQARHIAVGRNNWLFFGSEPSAEVASTWLSLIASAKIWGLDPEAYLRDLFRVLPDWPACRLLELAPKHWAQTRVTLDPADLACALGTVRRRSASAAEQAAE